MRIENKEFEGWKAKVLVTMRYEAWRVIHFWVYIDKDEHIQIPVYRNKITAFLLKRNGKAKYPALAITVTGYFRASDEDWANEKINELWK